MKRRDSLDIPFSELEECLPSDRNVEQTFDAKQLGRYISEWLDGLAEQDRMIFVRRYWLGDKAVVLAKMTGMTESGMSRKLTKLRNDLRKYLTKKGENI